MAAAFGCRLPFLMAAALIAAALADPVVESISNTGVFGGRYADTDHSGVVPTLFVGGVLVLAMLALRCIDIWRRSTRGCADGLIEIARGLAARSFARDFPAVFVLQLAALFVLESGEQLAADGKLLGGAVWLGGPLAFSLLAHALTGAACTVALGAFMRAVVGLFATIVRTAIHFIWLSLARPGCGGLRFDGRELLCPRPAAPNVRQIGGRAPPLLPTPA